MRRQSFAVLSKEGQAIICGVRSWTKKSSGDASPKMRKQAGGKTNFDTKNKLGGDDMYEDQTKKSTLASIKKSTIVETAILAGRHQGVWVRAKVLNVKENAMDIEVLLPKKWKVVGIALDVPKHLIRAVSDCHLENYTIPIQFTLDNSIRYISCNNKMKVEDLKYTIHSARGFPLDQIYFMHNCDWLVCSDCIPNDRIFCIIHRGERSIRNLTEMVSVLKRKGVNSRSFSGSVTSSRYASERRSF